jgi:signal transduction histidine kinase
MRDMKEEMNPGNWPKAFTEKPERILVWSLIFLVFVIIVTEIPHFILRYLNMDHAYWHSLDSIVDVVASVLVLLTALGMYRLFKKRHREAEAYLSDKQDYENRIRNLASFPELNPNPITELDHECRIKYLNPAVKRLMVNMEDLGIRHPWFYEVGVTLEKIKTGGNNIFTRDVWVGKSCYQQTFLWVEKWQLLRIYGIDITEIKNAGEALKNSIVELERSNSDLAQFAYVASHDLQEPLRMMTSYVQLLAGRYQGKLDSDADEFINYIIEGASRMQLLIKDLLAYSKVGFGAKKFEEIPFSTILGKTVINLRYAIEKSGAVITNDHLPNVYGDESQLVQLTQNLLDNSIKFHGKEKPIIHISCKEEKNERVLLVKDNGIGIEEQYYKRIFEIFQRLHLKSEYPGTGIGLAICKKVVEFHGGRIWVESRPGFGSTFFFALPRKGAINNETGTGNQAD